MDFERVKELKIIIENKLGEEVAIHQSMLSRHMPSIIVDKHARDVKNWEDLVSIIDEKLNGFIMINPNKIEISNSSLVEQGCEVENCKDNAPDMVNQPAHYTTGQFEVIDVIKDWLTEEEFRGYIKGNLIKYIARERFKNGDEDLNKAEFYLHYLNTDGEKGIK